MSDFKLGGAGGGLNFTGTSAKKGSKTAAYNARAQRLAAQEAAHNRHKSKAAEVEGFVGGLLGNLTHDVVDTGKGLPGGVVKMVRHPVQTAKDTVEQEKQTWGPLLRGDYHTFLHNFYEHPLGPALDVASIATLGAGAAAKVTRAAGITSSATRTVKLTENVGKFGTKARNAQLAEGKGVEVPLHDNPFIRMRQRALHQASIRLPSHWAFIGESQRATNALRRLTATKQAHLLRVVDDYEHARKRLSTPKTHAAFAAFLGSKTPKEYLDFLKAEGTDEPIHHHVLGDPVTNRLAGEAFDGYRQIKPLLDKGVPVQTALRRSSGISKTAKAMLIARDAAKKAADMDAELAKLDPIRRERRQYLHSLLHKDARFKPDIDLAHVDYLSPSHGKVHTVLAEVLKEHKAGIHAGMVEFRTLGGKKSRYARPLDVKRITNPDDRLKVIEAEKPEALPGVSMALHHSAKSVDDLITEIKGEHAKAGRPEPVYFPDVMVENKKASTFTRAPKRGLLTPGKIKNEASRGVLYMAGLINDDPYMLSRKVMNDVQAQRAVDIADTLRQHGQLIDHDKAVPKGYVEIDPSRLTREYIMNNRDEWAKEMEKYTKGEPPAVVATLFHSFVKGSAGHGSRKLVVSQRLLDGLAGDFGRSSRLTGTFKHISSIWKHAVLAGRPLPFIANNVVGNSIMYALRHAGPASIYSIGRMRGENRAFMDLFPEHHLTFGGSLKLHRGAHEGRTKRGAKFVGNLGYNVAGAHEHAIRRTIMTDEAIKNPLVRKYKKQFAAERKRLGSDAFERKHDSKTDLHLAMEKAFHEEPGLRSKIARSIDDTAGDYRSFSKNEDTIRGVMPFYAWNRHAMRWYWRMLNESPTRAAAMTELGRQGKQDVDKVLGAVPDFMADYLPEKLLGAGVPGLQHTKGDQFVFNAGVLNPMTTVADTVSAVNGAVHGQTPPPEIASMLSPLLTLPIEQLTGRSLLTDAPIKHTFGSHLGPLGDLVGRGIESIPQARLASAAFGLDQPDPHDPRNLYTPTGRERTHTPSSVDSDWHTLLENFLGVPSKNINLDAAHAWEQRIEGAQGPHFHAAKPRKHKGHPASSGFNLGIAFG